MDEPREFTAKTWESLTEMERRMRQRAWADSIARAKEGPSEVCVDLSKGRQRLEWRARIGQLISVDLPPLGV